VTLVFQVTAGGSVPVMAMNFGVKTALGIVEDLRDWYERNGKAVDKELMAASPPPPPKESLNEEQMRVVRSCLSLETVAATGASSASNDSSLKPASNNSSPRRLLGIVSANPAAAQARAEKGSWVELKSTSPFVSLSMEYTNPVGGGSR
jgi:hypothetical protein